MTHDPIPRRTAQATFCVALCLAAAAAAAAEPDEVDFDRQIRPLLSDKCFACHGPDEEQREADLRLDTEQGALAALDSEGFAIVRGDPASSVAYHRINTEEEDDRMPPVDSGKELTPDQIELIRRWIEQGAPWQQHWSFVPPQRPPPPPVQDPSWSRSEIDYFILARLEQEGLTPAPAADKRMLIRRLTFDLTGLPPTPAEVGAFLADDSAEAYARVVDRLIASPHYGEHMARYWLDAARYADTHGLHLDNMRQIWPYRDWVIRAFNANMPFDQFTIEQLAGDLLPEPTLDQKIATGFIRCNVTTSEGGVIPEEYYVHYTVDRVATTATVWMGLTMGCAVCHDHKFDPIKAKEFYQMFAFFNSIKGKVMDGNQPLPPPILDVPNPANQGRLDDLAAEIGTLEKQRDGRAEQVDAELTAWIDAQRGAGEAPTASAGQSGAGKAAAGNAVNDSSARNSRSSDRSRIRENSGSTANGPNSHEFGYQNRSRRSAAGQPAAAGPAGDLVGYWPLDETAGDKARNMVAGGQAGTIHGAEPAPGRIGGARRVDGDRFIDLGDTGDFERTDAFSFGAWVNVPAGNTGGAVLARISGPNSNRGYDLQISGDRVVAHFIHSWPHDAIKVETEQKLKLDEWQHVLVTYDGSSSADGVKIYLNGAASPLKVHANKLRDTIAARVSLRVGRRTPGSPLAGMVDEVRIYGRRLTPLEADCLAGGGRLGDLCALPDEKRTAAQQQALRTYYLANHDRQYRQWSDQIVPLARERRRLERDGRIATLIWQELPEPKPAYILIRGKYDKKGEQVQRATPAALPPLPALPEGQIPTRLTLARWLVSAEHPLTSRVTVNRFWQQYFGTGIVETAENFGAQGAAPSHPELLDWLAVDFRTSGWDVKRLQRVIVMSATYRQSSNVTPAAAERDPNNRLLARGPRFRLDAEVIRDNALALSGLLVDKIGGPSVKPYQPPGIWKAVGYTDSNTANFHRDTGQALYRRSLYTFWKRTAPPPNMVVFDAPSRETCTVRRTRTNTPLAALALMNDEQFVEASRHLAERTMTEGGATDQERARFAFSLATARPPTDAELEVLLNVFGASLTRYQAAPEAAVELIHVGESQVDSALDAIQLAAWTIVANLILNLDETITNG